MVGDPIVNPVTWEDDLASAILDDPTVPLTLEAHRQPRPRIAPPPGNGNEIWRQIHEHIADGSSQSVVASAEDDNFLLASLSIESSTSAPVVEGGGFKEWRWLGTKEMRLVNHPDRHYETDLVTERYRVMEVRDVNDRQALVRPPVTAGDLRMWSVDVDSVLGPVSLATSQPLVGEDRELTLVGGGRQGLGVPRSLLVPTKSLIALLKLRPGVSYSYEDEDGLALALVTWRTEYDTSDYYLAWPRTFGAGIVIRPDMFAQLVTTIGESRMVLRDFVRGDLGLLTTK